MNRAWTAAAAALLLAAPAAHAGVGQGDIEAGVSISLNSTEVEPEAGPSTKTDFGLISVSGGYFYSDKNQFKLALNMIVATDSTSGSINPGVDLVFSQAGSPMVPFVGAGFGFAVGAITETDFLDLHGGIKYFFKERASVELKLARYQAVDSDVEASHTDLTAGINIYF
jgi:hypothetical protein